MTLRSSSTMPTCLSLIYALWLQKSESLPAGTLLVACLFRHEPRSGDPFFWPQTLQAAPQKAPPPITSFGSDQ